MRFTLNAAKKLSNEIETFGKEAIASYAKALGVITTNASNGHWSDSKSKEFNEIMAQMNSYMKKALASVNDYQKHLKKKINELEGN